jgi:gluconate 2-dehydrogenase gamma chain
MDKVTRRSFVAAVGAAGTIPPAALLPSTALSAIPAPKAATGRAKSIYLFFNAEEVLFIEAACERLIPEDESGPGALGTGVPDFLDRQLAGAWGAGERLYRSGPWAAGTASQGYQLPLTPAELFHTSLRAIQGDLATRGTPFHLMRVQDQDAYLRSLESGERDLDGVPSAVFFDILLKTSVEGFFCDPVHGGNRGMAAWRMIGFPGAYADYFSLVDRHGEKFEREPMSLAEDAQHHIHMRPPT